MLSIHVLNVGQGSSIIVEIENTGGRHFGVIDSNATGHEPPKTLTTLEALGARSLAFVCLTHPHTDHFRGLYEIIQAYKGKIDHFYSCPFGDLLQKPQRLQSIKRHLAALLSRTDSQEQRIAAMELAQILRWADDGARTGAIEWFECRGDDFSIAPPGFADVGMSTILPPARVVGSYVERIMKPQASIIGNSDDNDLSLAFKLIYAGKTIVLGGDGTVTNWELRRRYEKNKQAIAAEAVNLPHHGSKKDCTPDVLQQLFANNGPRYGVTSSDGLRHPHLGVIEFLNSSSIHPYCTNLIPSCGANAQVLLTLPSLDPQLARWVREVADDSGQMQPCQGDILITIAPDSTLTVTPQYRNGCGYRGDWDQLLASRPHG